MAPMELSSTIFNWLVRFGWALTGVIVTGLYLYYLRAQSLPDLEYWHREDVAAELVPELERLADVTLPAYLEHEENEGLQGQVLPFALAILVGVRRKTRLQTFHP
jgi:hypothetical protein